MMRKVLFGAAMAAVMFLAGCGGGDEPFTPPPGNGGPPPSQLPSPSTAPALKASLAAKFGVVNFPIGAAIEPASTLNADAPLLLKHFSSITAENAMKPLNIWPNMPNTAPAQPAASPNFVEADVIANFAAANGIRLRGHTLVWHQSAPSWLFVGDLNNSANYHAALLQHLRTYITAVMGRYPEVYAWDVVNEAATDTPNAANPYRTDSLWYQAYQQFAARPGGEYVIDAFRIASEVRGTLSNPGMKLMLNDYNTELPGKRANVLKIVQDVINAGVPIDGVGHQFHLQVGADVAQVTAAFTAVEAISTTLVNHVTELDVSIYADPGTCYAQGTIPPCLPDYGASPPQSVLSQQATLYRALFNAFNRPSVQSVSLWGIADNHTWLNTYPVARTNRPLLFDTARDPKWAFWTVVDPSITVP